MGRLGQLWVWARRVMAVGFIGVMVACGPAFVAPPEVQFAETGRVYGLVTQSGDVGALERAAEGLGYEPQGSTDLDGLGLFMVSIDLPPGVGGREAIGALEAAVPGATVGVNHAYRLQQVNSGAARRTFANDMLGWPDGSCAAQTSIGLIDGGVDPTAPALRAVPIVSADFGESSAASLRHGTEVASVLVDPSRIRAAELFSVNVMVAGAGGGDLAGAAGIVQALDWMAARDVGLVNVSLAGPPNKLLRQAVEAATDRGMTIVAAVGNTGRASPEQHPAALPTVIAVTAVDARQRVFRDAVRGTHVDFAAPGVDIFVETGAGERFVSGTSMAAPFVTAVMATLPQQDKSALMGAAIDLGLAGKDETFGFGLVQAPASCQ